MFQTQTLGNRSCWCRCCCSSPRSRRRGPTSHRQLQVCWDVALLILVVLPVRLLAVDTEIDGAEGVIEAAVGHVLNVGGEEGGHHQGMYHA